MGFEFSIEDVWMETLAFRTGERENKGENEVVSVFEWQFWNKTGFILKLGACVNPKFW